MCFVEFFSTYFTQVYIASNRLSRKFLYLKKIQQTAAPPVHVINVNKFVSTHQTCRNNSITTEEEWITFVILIHVKSKMTGQMMRQLRYMVNKIKNNNEKQVWLESHLQYLHKCQEKLSSQEDLIYPSWSSHKLFGV